jgi:hypothetical protein
VRVGGVCGCAGSGYCGVGLGARQGAGTRGVQCMLGSFIRCMIGEGEGGGLGCGRRCGRCMGRMPMMMRSGPTPPLCLPFPSPGDDPPSANPPATATSEVAGDPAATTLPPLADFESARGAAAPAALLTVDTANASQGLGQGQAGAGCGDRGCGEEGPGIGWQRDLAHRCVIARGPQLWC